MIGHIWLLTCRMIKIGKADGKQTEELLGFTYKGDLQEALFILAARSEYVNAKANRSESVYYAVVGANQIPKLSDAAMAGAHIEKVEDLIPPGYPGT